MACRSLCDEFGKQTEELPAVSPRLHRNSTQRLIHEPSHKHPVNAGNSLNDIEMIYMKASAVMVVGYATGCIAIASSDMNVTSGRIC